VVEAVVFAGISTLLYHLGMGFVLFLVPLQVVLVRRGRRPFFTSLGAAFALILVVKLIIQGGSIGGEAAPFSLLEISVVLAFMGGLVLVQVPELFPQTRLPAMRRVTRLVAVTAAVGVVSLPLVLYLRGSETFNAGLREVFDALAAALQRTLGGGAGLEAPPATGVPEAVPAPGGMDAGLLQAAFSGEALMSFVGQIFWRGYLFSYLLMLGLSWWLGTRLGTRFPSRPSWRGGRSPEGGEAPATRAWPRIVEFRLPDAYVWPLIASLAVILLGLVVDLGPLGLAAWNAGVILLFLYGVSGIGVLQYFLRRFRVPRGMRVLLAILLCILVFSPRANLAVFILIPGLGVSEIWLKYRTRERSNG
jgi:hypothetical protein